MEETHPVKAILQLHLASDANAVIHLPYILDTLAKDDFIPSPHTHKWIARVNSLIHSKDSAARWSGLCLAFQTAKFSKDVLLECAQSWVSAAMPLLVNQPVPTTKAAIRLLRLIFSSAMDVSEFQRQLCIPNVPKFANALIAIIEQKSDSETMLLVIQTLTHMVSLYPSLCRPLHGSMSNIALRYLNGSAPTPMSGELVEVCSRLYAALPITGGKVNAPNLWRKSLDDTVAFAWGAFLQLRTTCPDRGNIGNLPRPGPKVEDPVIAVPLALDRLRAAVQVIDSLLSSPILRPISLPLGSLMRLSSALLQCSAGEKSDANVDHVVHALEQSVVPSIWKLSSEILDSVSQAGQHHITPHLPTLLTHLAYHLEQSRSPPHTLQFLRTVSSLLANGPQLHDNVIASRLARATMPLLAVILSQRTPPVRENEQAVAAGRSKKGKKRARGYDGDEVFKVGREIVCHTTDEGNVLLASVELLESLLFRSQVTAPVYSITSRLLLSIYAFLPQLPPTILSSDLSLHPRLYAQVQRVCVNLAMGTTSVMSKTLAFILALSDSTLCKNSDLMVPIEVDLLLHPRMPPLVRSLPQVEMLSLCRAEESQEEIDTRKRVGVDFINDHDPRRSDVSGSLTPQDAGQTSLSSAPQLLHADSGTNTVASTTQETNIGIMHTEAPTFTPSQEPFTLTGIQTRPAVPPAAHLVANDRLAQTPLPPPPPCHSTAALGAPSATAVIPPVTSVPASTGEDDDEPMPTIDLGSDSDSE